MKFAWIFATELYFKRVPVWHTSTGSDMFPRMLCGRRAQRFRSEWPRYAQPLQLRHADIIGKPCRTCLMVAGKLV